MKLAEYNHKKDELYLKREEYLTDKLIEEKTQKTKDMAITYDVPDESLLTDDEKGVLADPQNRMFKDTKSRDAYNEESKSTKKEYKTWSKVVLLFNELYSIPAAQRFAGKLTEAGRRSRSQRIVRELKALGQGLLGGAKAATGESGRLSDQDVIRLKEFIRIEDATSAYNFANKHNLLERFKSVKETVGRERGDGLLLYMRNISRPQQEALLRSVYGENKSIENEAAAEIAKQFGKKKKGK